MQAGFGSYRLYTGDMPVYADLSRWKIRLRYRCGTPNNNANNADDDNLQKFKRGYFIKWRMADKHKAACFDQMDYYIDYNRPGDETMIPSAALLNALCQMTRRPFRTVPYADPGVWGG